jgi:hypothetical protein
MYLTQGMSRKEKERLARIIVVLLLIFTGSLLFATIGGDVSPLLGIGAAILTGTTWCVSASWVNRS